MHFSPCTPCLPWPCCICHRIVCICTWLAWSYNRPCSTRPLESRRPCASFSSDSPAFSCSASEADRPELSSSAETSSRPWLERWPSQTSWRSLEVIPPPAPDKSASPPIKIKYTFCTVNLQTHDIIEFMLQMCSYLLIFFFDGVLALGEVAVTSWLVMVLWFLLLANPIGQLIFVLWRIFLFSKTFERRGLEKLRRIEPSYWTSLRMGTVFNRSAWLHYIALTCDVTTTKRTVR